MPGDGSEEPLMGDKAREALLGRRDAGAVGMVLEEDRSKEDVVEVEMENGFTFWSTVESEMVNNDLIAFLQMKSIGEDNPLFMLLNKLLDNKAQGRLSEGICSSWLGSCLEHPTINSAQFSFGGGLVKVLYPDLLLVKDGCSCTNSRCNPPELPLKFLAILPV
ncbi:hypothetical protein BU17DRAFT_68634 [Hysterangium stoloniferum]|nr:hypothetical protein BU17DRAFT_68634 [Hysterangium stoloniferum]